jgi:pSer/pThr/pTyr-binding forkhead associated (FHA) protein
MGSLLLKFIVGAIAGLFAWMIFEPSAPKDFMSQDWAAWESTYVLGLGALIGLAVGGLDGFTRGGKRHTMQGLGLGLILGGIGASFGHGIFGLLVRTVFGSTIFATGSLITQMPARIVAFAGIGVCLGAAIGAASLNVRKIVQGAIGGAIGGAVAGAFFDPISMVVANATVALQGGNEVGGPGRAIMALLMGAAIALFIGIVDRLSRSAWLRLSLGRNEGKEWSIDSAQTFIGRSESAQVPLFGDPNVAPIHASIQKQGGQYILVDGGSPAGTLLNGQFIQQAPLFNGAQITIGSFVLQFLVKNQAAPVQTPEMYQGQAYPLQPQQPPQPTAAYQQTPSAPTQAFTPQPSQPTIAYGGPMQPAPGQVAIVAIDGPLMGQRFPVSSTMELGRDLPSIPMSFDTAASRRHATLAPAPNGLSVNDSGSTNGTFVNGQRVSQAFAKIGDLVKIGSTTFRVET